MKPYARPISRAQLWPALWSWASGRPLVCMGLPGPRLPGPGTPCRPSPAAACTHTALCQKPPTTLLLGYRELPDLEPDALQKLAEHCNDRRMASKRVQELSTGLFFAVLVKVRPPAWRPLSPPLPHLPSWAPAYKEPSRNAGASTSGGALGDATAHGQALAGALSRRRVAPWSQKPWCWVS